MQGSEGFGTTRSGQAPLSLFVSCLCVLLLAAGCSKSEKSDGTLDTSRLPRVAGAKEVFASPASTIFTTTNPVTQTADTVDKALATEGWQKYVAPNTSLLASDSQRSLSLKKGPFALGVFITVAPAQGNATSVQYNAVTLKNDVPFPKDASNIEFDPEQAIADAAIRGTDRQDPGILSQGTGAAGLVAVVAKTQRRAAGDPAHADA